MARGATDAGPSHVASLVAGGVAFGAVAAFLSGLTALLLPVMVGLLLVVIVTNGLGRYFTESGRQRLMVWTIVAFVTHLVFGLVVTNFSNGLIDFMRAPDSSLYDQWARDIVRHWTTGLPGPTLPAGKEGYYYLLAGVYWLVGAHTAAGIAVNAAIAALLVPLVTDTTRRLFGVQAALRAPVLLALLPGLFLWSAQLLKEAPILLLVALAANLATRIVKRMSLASFLGLALTIALLLSFRAWVGLVVAGGTVGGITLGRRQLAGGISTGLSALALVAVVVSLGVGYSGYQAAVSADLTQANQVRQELAQAGTGYDANVDVSNSKAALGYLPRGLASFMFGPFPWQVHSRGDVAVIPDVLVWWMLLPSLWRGLRAGRRRIGMTMSVLVLPAAITAVLLALSVGNFGTVVRERGQVTILLVPIIALGLSLRGNRSPALAEPDAVGSVRPENEMVL